MAVPVDEGCISCGKLPAGTSLSGEGPLCDRCFDDRISAHTGWPRLPDAPAPVTIRDADGVPHTMIYRLMRMPGGISVRLHEQDWQPGEGYEFSEGGEHDADPQQLVDRVTVRARTEMARRYLTRDSARGWDICHHAGDFRWEVAGRIDSVGPEPVMLVVDGRAVSWDDLGEALSSYEGWQFVLRIGDPSGDPREPG